MLFRKDIEARCAYCSHAGEADGENVLCSKRGLVSRDYSCRRFSYDPLKRTPPPRVSLHTDGLDKDDFSL